MPSSRRSPPPVKGTYVLHFRLDQERVVDVRSRSYALPPGEYLYVGSAFGSGGLGSRVGRHLAKGQKRKQWDIDFVLAAPLRPRILEAWGVAATRNTGSECTWAATIFRTIGTVPVVGSLEGSPRTNRGFGAGDCRRRCGCQQDSVATCRTHLFRVTWVPTFRRMRSLLGGQLEDLRSVLLR